jgi:glycerophosphoryl diester phosphodiesterase
MAFERAEVKWISHRGVTTRAVENTRRAFQDAVAAGFTILETDLIATRDGVVVLSHDDDLSHVADTSRRITESSYDELMQVRLRDGQRILSFDDFVSEFNDQEWILDLKPETVYRVVDILHDQATRDDEFAAALAGNARFLCWSWRHQRYCQSRLPRVPFMARESECYRAVLSCLLGLSWLGGITPGKTYALTTKFRGIQLIKPSIVDVYHRRGARVVAYLPSTEREIATALQAGVDEIILDFVYDGIDAGSETV